MFDAISIAVDPAPRRMNVLGTIVEGVLGVHESHPKGWTITHLGTGLAIHSWIVRRDSAMAAARKLAKVVDWSFTDPSQVDLQEFWGKCKPILAKVRCYPPRPKVRETLMHE